VTSLLGYDAVTLGDWFPTFRRIVGILSSKVEQFYVTAEDEVSTVFRNVRNDRSNNTTLHLQRFESSF
jgi:hypothetical protein